MSRMGFGVNASGGGTILAQSAVAVSHTGTITLTTIATVIIPGGLMGANGWVEIDALWSGNDATDNKGHRIYLGGDIIYNVTQVGSPAGWVKRIIVNRGVTNSQILPPASSNGTGFSSALIATAANTDADVSITFRALLGNAADTITLEAYRVVVHSKA